MKKYINKFFWDTAHFVLGKFSPKMLVNLLYWRDNRRWIDWKNPKSIDEKIQWLKFYGDTSQWPQLADKYAVRDYVCEKRLEHILVPLLGKWDKAEDIDWDVLPNQFVMKTNHGSGDALICTDKSNLDTDFWTRFFAKQLKLKFGITMGEPHYNKISPCIIAEQLLDINHQSSLSTSIIDYKIWCFDGKPMYIFTCHNRTKEYCNIGLYDTQWNYLPDNIVSGGHYFVDKNTLNKPICLEEMLRVASKLSKGFALVRCDLYETNGHVYFGEMTMTPASGLNCSFTHEFRNILGDLCKIK